MLKIWPPESNNSGHRHWSTRLRILNDFRELLFLLTLAASGRPGLKWYSVLFIISSNFAFTVIPTTYFTVTASFFTISCATTSWSKACEGDSRLFLIHTWDEMRSNSFGFTLRQHFRLKAPLILLLPAYSDQGKLRNHTYLFVVVVRSICLDKACFFLNYVKLMRRFKSKKHVVLFYFLYRMTNEQIPKKNTDHSNLYCELQI